MFPPAHWDIFFRFTSLYVCAQNVYTAHSGKLLGCILAFFWASPLIISHSQNNLTQAIVLTVLVTIFGAPRLKRTQISRTAKSQWKYIKAFKELYIRVAIFLGVLGIDQVVRVNEKQISDFFGIEDPLEFQQSVSLTTGLVFLVVVASIRGMRPIQVNPEYYKVKIPKPVPISTCAMLCKLDFWRLFLALFASNAAFSSISNLHWAKEVNYNNFNYHSDGELQARWFAAALGAPLMGLVSDALLPSVSRFAFSGFMSAVLFGAMSLLHFLDEDAMLPSFIIISFCYSSVNVLVQVALLERFGAPASSVGRKYAVLSLGATLGCFPSILLILPDHISSPESEKPWMFASIAVVNGLTCLFCILRRNPKGAKVYDYEKMQDSILNTSFINKYAPPLTAFESFIQTQRSGQSRSMNTKLNRFTEPLLFQTEESLDELIVIDSDKGQLPPRSSQN